MTRLALHARLNASRKVARAGGNPWNDGDRALVWAVDNPEWKHHTLRDLMHGRVVDIVRCIRPTPAFPFGRCLVKPEYTPEEVAHGKGFPTMLNLDTRVMVKEGTPLPSAPMTLGGETTYAAPGVPIDVLDDVKR